MPLRHILHPKTRTVLTVLLAMLCLAGTLQARTLRVEIPGARDGLWIDLDQRRWWPEGDCDGRGWPITDISTSGDQLFLELTSTLEGDLPGQSIRTQQRFHLEVSGSFGTLRAVSPFGSADLQVSVRVEEDGRRTCSAR
jgi:hypothetical protein